MTPPTCTEPCAEPRPKAPPCRTHVVATESVWMEGEALRQLTHVAQMPGCVHAVGMPDLHPGPGIPIGAVFAFQDQIRPLLVGGDAGCGARVVAVSKARHRGDDLDRRIRAHTEGPALPEADPASLLTAAWSGGPRALAEVAGIPESLAALARMEPPVTGPPSGPVPTDGTLGRAIGTIGGGNHFLELSQVSRVVDKQAAARLGLRHGGLAVLAHSGSRGLGRAMYDRWATRDALDPADHDAYLADLRGACRFASANRFVLTWRLLKALGAARPRRIAGCMDVTHNTVVQGDVAGRPAWVHRKGSAPAERGQATVVLGSRGTPSWMMEGLGCPDTLCSVAHGAGRKMGRSEAAQKLRSRFTRASLLRTKSGGRVLCDNTELLYEEHPSAYKPVEPVIESLELAGAARRICALTPQFTIKR